MSNDNINLKSQFVTLEKWDCLRSQNVTTEGKRGQRRKYLTYAFTPKQWIEKTNAIGFVSKARRCGYTYGIGKCNPFKAVSGQQAVAQLTQIPCGTFNTVYTKQAATQLVQIPWGQNVTKNLPDEFRSSLPSIEEIETELSGGDESL